MVRTLLRDRFKLVVHMETRDTPIYALVKARANRWCASRKYHDERSCECAAALRRS